MADAQIRTIFKNDSVMGRYLDGDDEHYDDSPRSSVFSNTDSGETLVNSSRNNGGGDKSSGTGTYNTGPKGVRSDAAAYSASQARHRQDRLHHRAQNDTHRALVGESWAEESAEVDARDRWVEARLKELSKSRVAGGNGGMVEKVSASRYLQVIESHRLVCVLILDETEQESLDLQDVFVSLAPKYPGMKVIALSHLDAEIDEVACPALLLYRDAQLTVNAMRVLDELHAGEEVGRKSIEDMLFRIGVLRHEYKLDRD